MNLFEGLFVMLFLSMVGPALYVVAVLLWTDPDVPLWESLLFTGMFAIVIVYGLIPRKKEGKTKS